MPTGRCGLRVRANLKNAGRNIQAPGKMAHPIVPKKIHSVGWPAVKYGRFDTLNLGGIVFSLRRPKRWTWQVVWRPLAPCH
jgi:hypothetical protein